MKKLLFLILTSPYIVWGYVYLFMDGDFSSKEAYDYFKRDSIMKVSFSFDENDKKTHFRVDTRIRVECRKSTSSDTMGYFQFDYYITIEDKMDDEEYEGIIHRTKQIGDFTNHPYNISMFKEGTSISFSTWREKYNEYNPAQLDSILKKLFETIKEDIENTIKSSFMKSDNKPPEININRMVKCDDTSDTNTLNLEIELDDNKYLGNLTVYIRDKKFKNRWEPYYKEMLWGKEKSISIPLYYPLSPSLFRPLSFYNLLLIPLSRLFSKTKLKVECYDWKGEKKEQAVRRLYTECKIPVKKLFPKEDYKFTIYGIDETVNPDVFYEYSYSMGTEGTLKNKPIKIYPDRDIEHICFVVKNEGSHPLEYSFTVKGENCYPKFQGYEKERVCPPGRSDSIKFLCFLPEMLVDTTLTYKIDFSTNVITDPDYNGKISILEVEIKANIWALCNRIRRERRRNRGAYIIGVKDYSARRDSLPDLHDLSDNIVKCAENMKECLPNTMGIEKIYSKINKKSVKKETILKKIENLSDKKTLIFFYFIGHGDTITTDRGLDYVMRLEEEDLSVSEVIKKVMDGKKCDTLVMLLNMCFPEQLGEGGIPSNVFEEIIKQLKDSTGNNNRKRRNFHLIIIHPTGYTWGIKFTYNVMEPIIKGKIDDDGNGYISPYELSSYLEESYHNIKMEYCRIVYSNRGRIRINKNIDENICKELWNYKNSNTK